MTDKNQEQKKEGGCCGGASKTVSVGSCSTDKAEASKTDSKGKSGGCGCN